MQQRNERTSKRKLVLYRFESTDRAHQHQFRVAKRLMGKIRAARRRALEPLAVDAVANALDTRGGDADPLAQIGFDVCGQRDVTMDDGRPKAPDRRVTPSQTIEVGNIPAMLAMNAHRHPCERRTKLRLQRSKVACMDDVGP